MNLIVHPNAEYSVVHKHRKTLLILVFISSITVFYGDLNIGENEKFDTDCYTMYHSTNWLINCTYNLCIENGSPVYINNNVVVDDYNNLLNGYLNDYYTIDDRITVVPDSTTNADLTYAITN